MSIMKMFDSPKLDSRIKSRNVTGAEKWLGYLIGPAGVIIVNQILNSYLNVYYTDVLGATAWVGGTFMVLFPIVSKIIDAVTNLIMADIIDRTRTRQGKLRPFILLSIPVLFISVILLYTVPKAGTTVQMIWIVLSYNLYYSVAYTMYTISQQMLTATSTRNSEQRTTVGIFSSVSSFTMGGMVAFAIFPNLVYPMLQKNPDKWLPVMSLFSLIIIPLTLVQYFYTRERVTEEGLRTEKDGSGKTAQMNIFSELKLLVTDKSWLFLLLALFFKQLAIKFYGCSMIYYTNWIIAPDYTAGHSYYSIINLIGGGVGGAIAMVIVWPLAKKVGKTLLSFLTLLTMGICMGVCVFVPRVWPVVLLMWTITQTGSSLTLYVTPAMLADVVDEGEWKFGFRSDALTGAMVSVIMTVTAGIATGIFNGVLAGSGYVQPELLRITENSYAAQSTAVRNAIVFMNFGAVAVCFLLSGLFFSRIKSEKLLPTVQKELMERRKAEAVAEGREWVDPIEAARKETLGYIEENYASELEALKKKYSGGAFDARKAKLDRKYEAKRAKAAKRE